MPLVTRKLSKDDFDKDLRILAKAILNGSFYYSSRSSIVVNNLSNLESESDVISVSVKSQKLEETK